MGRITFLALLLFNGINLATARAQCTYDWRAGGGVPGLGDTVYAMTSWDPDGPGPQSPLLIAGGSFIFAVDAPVNRVAAWDGASWHSLGAGIDAAGQPPGYPPTIYAMTTFNGELIVAGKFNRAGGSPVNNIARWDGSSWRTLAGGLNNTVYALTVFDGKLIVGGSFTLADGHSAANVAVWDSSSWSSLGTGLGSNQSEVKSFASYNGQLMAGWTSGVSAWNGSTWQTVGGFNSGEVYGLAVFGADLYATGYFVSAGSVPANYIAHWNGSSWQPLGAGLNWIGNALVVKDGSLIAAGWFSQAGGSNAYCVGVWNGSQWLPYSGAVFGQAFCCSIHQGDLYVGGAFYAYTGRGYTLPRNITRRGLNWECLGPANGFDEGIFSQAEFNGELIVGGQFQTAGGISAPYIAAWDGSGWRSFTNSFNGTVQALTIYQDRLFAGGLFSLASYVCYWDGTGWNALDGGTNSFVEAQTVYNESLIVGGAFTRAGSVDASRIARWDGSAWHSLGSGMNDEVRALAVYNGELIAGGFFTSAGGVPVSYVAAWNGSSWRKLGTGFGWVTALGVHANQLYAGGGFHGIERWDGSTWTFIPGDDQVSAFTTYKGDLIAGRNSWDGISWSPLGISTAEVESLGTYRGDLVAGGWFETAGTQFPSFFGRYGPTGPSPEIVQQPPSVMICRNSMLSLSMVAAGNGDLTYQWQKSGQSLTDTPDIFGTQTDTLVFAHAQPVHSGPYTCVVTLNNCTQTTSNIATLTVYPTNSADGNADGIVDARDIQPFIDALTSFAPVSATLCAYDLTGEGIVDINDVPPFITRLLTQ